MSLYQNQQDPSKIVSSDRSGYTNIHMQDGESIPLSSLEAMWYGHEENIDHPEGSEYPTGVNEAHRAVMVARVADSVLNRTGIDINTFDGVIHASSSHADNFSIQNV